MSCRKCCVVGCNSKRGDGITLHIFPNPTKQVELFKIWVHNIDGDIVGLENDYIFKNRRVCGKHFEQRWFINNKQIARDALPTLFLGVTHQSRMALANLSSNEIISRQRALDEPLPSNESKTTKQIYRVNVCDGRLGEGRHEICYADQMVAY